MNVEDLTPIPEDENPVLSPMYTKGMNSIPRFGCKGAVVGLLISIPIWIILGVLWWLL